MSHMFSKSATAKERITQGGGGGSSSSRQHIERRLIEREEVRD